MTIKTFTRTALAVALFASLPQMSMAWEAPAKGDFNHDVTIRFGETATDALKAEVKRMNEAYGGQDYFVYNYYEDGTQRAGVPSSLKVLEADKVGYVTSANLKNPDGSNNYGPAPVFMQSGNNTDAINNGTIYVVGGSNAEHTYVAEALGTTGSGGDVINEGTIYVNGNNHGRANDRIKAMSTNANKAINKGNIFIMNGGVGLVDNSGGTNKAMINQGHITIEGSGVGINFRKEASTQVTNSGVITASGENAIGIQVYNDGKGQAGNQKTVLNTGKILASNGKAAIVIADATGEENHNLTLQGDSHVEGAVMLSGTTALKADNLTNAETINLVNVDPTKDAALRDLTINNSSLAFDGEGNIAATTATFDETSTLALKGTRTLSVETLNSGAVIEADHLAANGEKLVDIKSATEDVTVSLTKDVTAQMADATAAEKAVTEQIAVKAAEGSTAKTTTSFAQSDVLGEMTFVTEGGKVVDKDVKENTMLTAYGSVASLSAIAWRHEMNDLTKRMGELRMSTGEVGAWARIYGSENEYGAQNITMKNHSVQVGADAKVRDDLTVGAAFTYTDGSATYDAGSADNKSYGLAVYGTWMAENGLFVDGILKYNRLSNDFQLEQMVGDSDNNAFSASVEAGWHYPIADVAFVEPQVELTYGRVFGDTLKTNSGVTIEQDDFDSMIGRVGVRGGFYFPNQRGTIYARASVLHDFDGELNAEARKGVSHAPVNEDLGGTWYEFGLGANFNMTDHTYVYVDLERNNAGKVVESWRYNIGVRHAF